MIKRSRHSAWTYVASLLLLALMGNILFGGVSGLLRYKKSADSSITLDMATLHFFTKEYLERTYNKLTAAPLPTESALPSFQLFTSEQDIASLHSNLPESAKTRYISGHIKIDKPLLLSDVQMRYRGGLPLHWLYEKKSFRIKLPPYTTYRGLRNFNLVNPSTHHTITDLVSYNMSRDLGLLTPQYFPVRLYINNEANGLHYFLSQIDESFLRNNRRMPGSIYYGDTIFTPNPFEASSGVGERTFVDDNGDPLMWTDARLWAKKASRNTESSDDRSDIQKYINIINTPDSVAFMEEFNTYFDKEKFYTFWGLDTLVGSYHHDNFHNHKIYFDPYKGKFEPIQWDIRFWSRSNIKDIPLNPLIRQIGLNPILEYERDKMTFSLMQQYPVDKVTAMIEQASSIVEKELAADPFRQTPIGGFGRFSLDKEVPFSMSFYRDGLEELKLFYSRRQDYLQQTFDTSIAQYAVTEDADDHIVVTIVVSGNSPITFSPSSLFPGKSPRDLKIFRLYEGKERSILADSQETLYPGRSIQTGNAFGVTGTRGRLALGGEMLLYSPLKYSYRISGINKVEVQNLEDIVVANAVTNKSIPLSRVAEHADITDTASVHPWEMDNYLEADLEEITLSGKIQVEEDMIFSPLQRVTIAPGTVISLSRNASIIFYGQLIALGTESSPIQFRRAIKEEAWGSIVLQGAGASDSRLGYIQVSGGSVTSQRLINYPGQVNIHDVSSFTLDNCLIRENTIGDDALHISYSQGEVNNCRFEDTAFDAIDIDIANVKITNSEFHNSGNDALDLMSSKVTVSNVSIIGAGDKCFSVGESSQVTIKSSRLEDCATGVAVKDESEASLEKLEFHNIREWAIALYRKNPRYGAGGIVRGNKLYGVTTQEVSMDSASKSFLTEQSFLPLSARTHARTDELTGIGR